MGKENTKKEDEIFFRYEKLAKVLRQIDSTVSSIKNLKKVDPLTYFEQVRNHSWEAAKLCGKYIKEHLGKHFNYKQVGGFLEHVEEEYPLIKYDPTKRDPSIIRYAHEITLDYSIKALIMCQNIRKMRENDKAALKDVAVSLARVGSIYWFLEKNETRVIPYYQEALKTYKLARTDEKDDSEIKRLECFLEQLQLNDRGIKSEDELSEFAPDSNKTSIKEEDSDGFIFKALQKANAKKTGVLFETSSSDEQFVPAGLEEVDVEDAASVQAYYDTPLPKVSRWKPLTRVETRPEPNPEHTPRLSR